MINIFLKNTHFEKEQIKSFKKIKSGFSNNNNFLIETINLEKFQLRVPIFKNDYSTEGDIFEKHFPNRLIYLNKEEGVMIKKWIKGVKPDIHNKEDRKEILNALKHFHSLEPPKKIRNFGFEVYKDQYRNLDKKLLIEFNKTLKELNKEPKTLIHGDINLLNMLKTNSGIELIDFEWVSIGPWIIDYAYLISFSDFDINEISEFTKYSISKLYNYSRFLLIHTIMWAKKVNSNKSKELLNYALSKLSIKE